MSPFPSAIRGTDPVRRFVPLREQPDDRLVALARGGSDEAFSEIVRRYERPLRGYCSRIVDPVRAEDAVQQAFLQALRALRGPDRRELALKAWLHTIARNCAIDLHTGRTTHTFEELDGGALDASPSPPRLAEQREELSQLMTGLRRLPDGQRRALLLRELEGRSYEEIGAEIGRTPSGVRQTIFRARTALREAVAVFGPPVWLRALWPFGGGAPGRSLEALAAAGAAIVAVAGTAGLPAPDPAPDGVRSAGVASAAVAEPSSADSRSASAPHGAPLAPARPPRRDTPVSRPPLPGADPPASTGPAPRPLRDPTPGKGAPDGGQAPSVPEPQIVAPPPSAGEQGEGQAPPVSDSGSGSSGSGSSGPDSSGSGSSGSGSGSSGSGSDDGSGRRGHSGSGSGSSGSDSSGSGSDGSGTSGSGSSGSGSSGSRSSGSGSSGSGSGDDSGESDR